RSRASALLTSCKRRRGVIPKTPRTAKPEGCRPRSLHGRLVEVKIHADQDQRPENRRDQGRDDLLDAVELRPVVVRGRHDAAGDEIDEQEDADPWPGSRCRGCVISHTGWSTSFRPFPGSPLMPFENPEHVE